MTEPNNLPNVLPAELEAGLNSLENKIHHNPGT